MHGRRTSRIASLLAGVVVASSLVLVAAPAAHAADAAAVVTGGRVTWGVKSSFRSYLVSAGAAGSVTPSAEATQESGNGRLRFPVQGGEIDPGAGTASARTVGAVRMTGHGGILDVSLTDLRVAITGTTGTLYLDATSRPYTGPAQTTPADPVTYTDVAFATLDLSGITPTTATNARTWTDIPAKLTAAGVPILAGFYPAGTDLDPITLATTLNQVPTCTIGTPRITAVADQAFTAALSPGTCTPAGATRVYLSVRIVGESDPYFDGWVDLDETTFSREDIPMGKTLVVRVGAMNDLGVSANQQTAVTVLPFKTIDAFTDQQFRDLRLRAATASEKTTWRTQLLGGKPASTAVQQLIEGPDWAGKQAPIIRLFQAYFKRVPDMGGLTYWTNKSRSGVRIGIISSNFAGSNEFKNAYGKTTNRAFVELVYDNVLGRHGDAGGIASWTRKLDLKLKSRGEVMVGFSESNEYKNKTASQVSIIDFYTGLFKVVPPKTTIDQAAGLLLTGTTLNQYIEAAMRLPDYAARIKA